MHAVGRWPIPSKGKHLQMILCRAPLTFQKVAWGLLACRSRKNQHEETPATTKERHG